MKLPLHFLIEKVDFIMKWVGICGSLHELTNELCVAFFLNYPQSSIGYQFRITIISYKTINVDVFESKRMKKSEIT